MTLFNDPLQQILLQTGSGIGSGITRQGDIRAQSIIDELVRGPEFQEDPLTAILQSRLTPKRQQDLLGSVGQFQQQQAASQANQLKSFNELRKEQQQELERQASVDSLMNRFPGQFERNDLENLPQTQLNDLNRNYTKLSEKETPVDKAFSTLLTEDIKQRPAILDEVTRTKTILDVVQDPTTSFESAQGKIRNLVDGTYLERFFPRNLSQATLKNLIVQGAKDLKNSFGARVTNFDFAKWLQGQPGTDKTQAANFALAMMANNNAEMRQEINDLSLEAINLFGDDSQAELKWKRDQEKQIRKKWQSATLEALNNFKQQPQGKQRGTRGTQERNANNQRQTSDFEGADRLRKILE